MYSFSRATGGLSRMSSNASIWVERSRSRASRFRWASAPSTVSTPRSFQRMASRWIWGSRGIRPGPYFRWCSSMVQLTASNITSAGSPVKS